MTVTYDRLARLEEVRSDPTGWGSIDLGTLLEAWDFKRRTLGPSHGDEVWFYWHERNPKDWNVTLPAAEGIAFSIVERVVWIIDSVKRLTP